MNIKKKIAAYDKAVEEGMHDLSQYLSIKGFIEQAAPANVLIMGGGHDAEMYVEAARSKDEDGTVVFLEEDNNWCQTLTEILDSKDTWIYKVDYIRASDAQEPANGTALNVFKQENFKWDVILVDPGLDQFAVRDACKLAKRLKSPETWVFVTNTHQPDILSVVEEQLGQTKHFVKGFKLRNTRWSLYAGHHAVKEKQHVGIIKQV